MRVPGLRRERLATVVLEPQDGNYFKGEATIFMGNLVTAFFATAFWRTGYLSFYNRPISSCFFRQIFEKRCVRIGVRNEKDRTLNRKGEGNHLGLRDLCS